MKRIILLAAIVLCSFAAMQADDVMSRESGVTVINTSTLAPGVRGFKGATPLKIYIRKNKIQKIEALPNEETPKFFARVKSQLLGKWDKMSVKKALKAEVDGVTGATYSSKAVIKNVKAGLEYFQSHK